MLNRIREYILYRKNKKTAKREFAKMISAVLPAIEEFAENKADILTFIKNLALSAKNMEGSALTNMVINAVADMFSVNQERFIETGSYLFSLSPEDMQKILVHSMVETIHNSDKE